MATGQDVRDILAIPSGGQNANASSSAAAGGSGRPHPSAAARSGSGGKKKKPARVDGISRELYALLGDNTPSLTFAQSAFADGAGGGADGGEAGRFRPKFKRTQRVQKWTPAKFRNPARQDDLVLRHWVPVGEEEEERRIFAEQQAGQQEQKQRTQQRKKRDDAANGDHSVLGEDDEEDKPDIVPRIYRFADLNTASGVYRYSNDEYHQHLRDEDWTKEETDYLIELCTTYDLRFVIITDRYEWPGKQRSMEDLKARYYAICRRLIRSRISTDDIDARQQLVLTYSFDRVREQERKKHVARLFSRTPQQLAEEEALYVEARRLEQNEASFAAEREELLRLLGGWERLPNVRSETVAAAGSGVGGGPTASSIGGGAEDEAATEASRNRSRKRKASESVAGAAEASTLGGSSTYSTAAAAAAAAAATGAPLTSKQKAELRAAQFDELHNIVRFDPQASINMANVKPPYPHLTGTPSTYPPTSTNASASHGVYLRSTRMLTPRTNLALRTQESLAELRPPVSLRLTFPTRANCEKWEGVVGAVTSGLEMKRQLDRVQSEVRISQMRAQQRQQSQSAAGTSLAVTGARSGTAAARSVTPQLPLAAPPASAPATITTTSTTGEAET